ncbi:unnamed protein product [Phytomonas sp. Hart1]|nr:unnamed protein product [Phytomonas sp. Hart1]|eukprot:CCW69809.1 unnamed protein product [Phytomonas sp. isolate Hart1]
MSSLADHLSYEALWDGLGVLEDAREGLHAALRESYFALSSAQWVEECRGRLIAYEAVPLAEGAVRPTVGLVRSTIPKNAEETNTEKKEEEAEVSWEIEQLYGASNSVDANHTHAEDSKNDEQRSEPFRDSIFLFSAAPSEELRHCQQLFQRVLEHVVNVDRAQNAALRVASNLEV